MSRVSKILSRNDLGLTGGHQAGICVPKEIAAGFFPRLDKDEYNPRIDIPFDFNGSEVVFTYIYYNNRLHGKGTRNEYRLTGMTKFLRDNECRENDRLQFSIEDGEYSISIRKQLINEDEYIEIINKPIVIKSGWYLGE